MGGVSCRSNQICVPGSWQCQKPNAKAPSISSRHFRRKAYTGLREEHPDLPEEWPQDGPRHGFGTYRFKVTRSFGTVADEMGNSEAVIRSRYFRSVSSVTAEAYWKIYPAGTPPNLE